MLSLFLLLLACAPSPTAALEGALERPLSEAERGQLSERGLAVVLHDDRVQVVGFGWGALRGEGRLPSSAPPIALDGKGLFRDADTRGMLVSPLYDQVLSWAESWKDVATRTGDPDLEFQGDLWLFVDQRTADATLNAVIFTSAQAQFGKLHVLTMGPTVLPEAPPPPPLSGQPDPTRRDSPLSPLRIGHADGQDYAVDDRAARIRVDTLLGENRIPTADRSTMDFLRSDAGDPVLYSTYTAAAAAATYPVLPSVEMLLHVSKHLDDELMAELQRAREPVRRDWLSTALEVAADQPEARAWLEVAQALERGEAPTGAADFLASPIQSRPVGIYGEHEDLARVFRRDRWLSQPISPTDRALVKQLAVVLSDPRVAPGLQGERAHRAVWTNPASAATVEQGGLHVLAPARNHEQEWIDAQGGTARVPDPMDAWIGAIQAGETDLALRPDSGWYDRQQWALEPLLTHPDAYEVGPGYAKRLREAFQVGVALRRETHVKDLTLPSVGAAMTKVIQAYVAPELRVEPVPTHYERSAASYAWLAEVALARGEVDGATWAPRVQEMHALYAGLGKLSRVDLGLGPGTPVPTVGDPPVADPGAAMLRSTPTEREPVKVEPGSEQLAVDWLERWAEEPVLAADVRVVVPIGVTADRRTIGWAVLGVRPVDLVVTYVEPPAVHPLSDGVELDVHTMEARYTVLAPYFTEVEMAAPLDRAAFRALGDEHRLASAFIEALEAGP